MQRRLSACGIRPINNLVDITNYVMEEFGQPMHAYDLDTIADHKIVVRRAEDGENFVTLDGQERELDSGMLMICDGEKPVGLAGIMGGENSMYMMMISRYLTLRLVLTELTSVFHLRELVLEQMLQVSLKKDLILTMQNQLLTEHVS